MRLGQLSRQTGLRSAEIVDFLADQKIIIKSGSNAKVDNEYVELVYSGFNLQPPVDVEEKKVEPTEPESESESQDSSEADVVIEDIPLSRDAHSEINELFDGLEEEEEFSAEEVTAIKEKIEAQKIAKEEADRPENPNLIKAPKVSLQGLKVVGKIDLPEPKVKEEVVETEESAEVQVEKPKPIEVVRHKKRNSGQNRQSQRNRNANINPVELQRQKDEKVARQRKKRELRKEKEIKRQYYHKLNQDKKKEKEAIRKETPSVEATDIKKPALKPKKVTRGNFISRLWRWLDATDSADN